MFAADKGGSVLAVKMLSETEAWVATTYSKSILDNGAAMLHTTDGKSTRAPATTHQTLLLVPTNWSTNRINQRTNSLLNQPIPTLAPRRQNLGCQQNTGGRGRRHCVNGHQRNMRLRLGGDHRTGTLCFCPPSHFPISLSLTHSHTHHRHHHHHTTSRLPGLDRARVRRQQTASWTSSCARRLLRARAM